MTQLVHIRKDQLALPELVGSEGRDQFRGVHQPELISGWTLTALPAGQSKTLSLQSGQLNLEQPSTLRRRDHQRCCPRSETERHQQAQPPAFTAAGWKLQKGVVPASEAPGHQPAEGEMVRPVRITVPQQGFQLFVGLGFQHRTTLRMVAGMSGSARSIDQHGVTRQPNR